MHLLRINYFNIKNNYKLNLLSKLIYIIINLNYIYQKNTKFNIF